jgi:hypothetical protein
MQKPHQDDGPNAIQLESVVVSPAGRLLSNDGLSACRDLMIEAATEEDGRKQKKACESSQRLVKHASFFVLSPLADPHR